MLPHDVVEFRLGDFVAHLGERGDNVFARDVPTVVRVELVEYRCQFVVVQEGLDVERASQELRVVDLVVSEVVYLIYDLLDLLRGHVQVRLLDCLSQLLRRDFARVVLVNFCELLLQVLDLVPVDHFHKHVHGCLFQHTHALELAEASQLVPADVFGLVIMALALLLDVLEPLVLQGLSGGEPFPRVDDQQLCDQIDDEGRTLLELFVVEVVFGLLDLGEDLSSVGALER